MKRLTSGRTVSKDAGRLLCKGVGSISLFHTMSDYRARVAAGSIAGDWKNIGQDMRHSITTVRPKREREPG
jgi:hypothetical protein